MGFVRAVSERSRVATKTKLEQAIEERASTLNDAQRELVMSQFSTYKRNRARMAEIDSQLKILNSMHTATREEVRMKQAERSTLSYEHNQLATANSKIAAELFDQLGDRS